MVPEQLSKLLDHIALHPTHLSNIASVLVGGNATAHKIRDKSYAMGLPIIYSYGATETCGQVTGTTIGQPSVDSGKALSGVVLDVLDARLTVSTNTLAKGYIDSTGFQPILAKGSKVLVTQDKARIINQTVYIHGRVDHQFKSGSVLICPHHIESIMMQSGLLKRIQILPAPDPTYTLVPIAYYELDSATIDAVTAYATQTLPLAMQPKQWYFF